MLKEGLVQESSSNAVKPANSFTEVTGPIATCNELTPYVIIRDEGWNYLPEGQHTFGYFVGTGLAQSIFHRI